MGKRSRGLAFSSATMSPPIYMGKKNKFETVLKLEVTLCQKWACDPLYLPLLGLSLEFAFAQKKMLLRAIVGVEKMISFKHYERLGMFLLFQCCQ